MELFAKPISNLIDPFLLTFYRFLIGFFVISIFFFATGAYRDLRKLNNKKLFMLFILGFLNIFISMSLLQLAVQHTTAATAAVVISSNPLFVLIIEVLLRDEELTFKSLLPLLLGAAGMYFIFRGKDLSLNYGVAYALIASLCFAVYSVIGKKTVKDLSPITVNVVSFLFGIAALFAFLLFKGKSFYVAFMHDVTGVNFWRMMYLGVLVSGIAYITFFATLKRYTAVSASYIFLFKPILATIFAILFLGEGVSKGFWLGITLIMLASFSLLPKKLITGRN